MTRKSFRRPSEKLRRTLGVEETPLSPKTKELKGTNDYSRGGWGTGTVVDVGTTYKGYTKLNTSRGWSRYKTTLFVRNGTRNVRPGYQHL